MTFDKISSLLENVDNPARLRILINTLRGKTHNDKLNMVYRARRVEFV
jgi:hypothetical protein